MFNEKIFLYINRYSNKETVNMKKIRDFNEKDKKLADIKKNRIYKYFNNIIIQKISLRKNLILFNVIFIIYLFFSILLIHCNQRKIYLHDSSIHLKVKAPEGDNIRIISEGFYNIFLPDEIQINGNTKGDIQYSYNPSDFLSRENNDVIITWNNEIITSTNNMFDRCSDIIEIDFSEFDSSKITEMNYMFKECTSLTSLILDDFTTSEVKRMIGMFVSCTALISLDLWVLIHRMLKI